MKKLNIKLSKEQMKKVENKNVNSGYCTGCTPTTPNGHCSKVNGECTWIPEIG